MYCSSSSYNDYSDADEEQQYRGGVNGGLPAGAQLATSDFYEDNDEPVYRSVSLAPAMAADPFSFGGGGFLGDSLGRGDGGCFGQEACFTEPPVCASQTMAMPALRRSSPSASMPPLALFRPSPAASQALKPRTSITEPPAIPAGPFPIERSHVRSRFSPPTIYNKLVAAFSEEKIDCDFKEHKFKFKCVSYAGTVASEFVVRVFAESPGAYLIEFQRRSGCCFAFQTAYASLCGSLSAILSVAPSAALPRAMATPAMCAAAAQAPVVIDCKPLHGMLAARQDQQVEALALLAKVSQRPGGPEALTADGTLPLLFGLLSSESNEVRRLATTVLAACSRSEAVQTHAALAGLAVNAIPELCAVLCATAELATMELARQTRMLLGAVLHSGVASAHPQFSAAQVLVGA